MAYLLTTANLVLPLLYLALLIDYGASFFLRTRTHARNPWLIPVVAAHAAFLVLLSVHLGRPAVVTNPEVLSVAAMSMVAVYAVLEAVGRDRRTGVFVLLLVFLFQYTSAFLLMREAGAARGQSVPVGPWARLHVLPAALAYTSVSVAAIYGLLHLVARRSLKRRRFGPLFDRLPPLDRLARMSWHAVVVGFVMLTVTIVTAAALGATGRFGPADAAGFWNPKVTTKVVIGGAAWLIYAAAVVGRLLGKWSPFRVSLAAVNGFVAIVLLFALSTALS